MKIDCRYNWVVVSCVLGNACSSGSIGCGLRLSESLSSLYRLVKLEKIMFLPC